MKTVQSPIGAEVIVDGRRYVNFAGSTYLGLSGHPQVLEAGLATLRETGAGYQFPWFLSMPTRAHQEVATEAAIFFGSQAAVFLSAGYQFGLAVIGILQTRFTVVFFDELTHYCLRDAIAISGLRSFPFRHLEAADLERCLDQRLQAGDRPLIVSDGMYAALGEIAPLADLAKVARPYGGKLLIDESHSFGVLGPTGRGICEHHGISSDVAIRGGSVNKAFGVIGGLIPASTEDADACRSTPVGRGASPGLAAAAAMCARSLRIVREHPELLQRLRANVRKMKEGLRHIGLDVRASEAPVASFTAGTDTTMATLQKRLMSEGVLVPHLRYIGAGPSGVMRCGIFADHTDAHIDRLLDALRRLL